MKFLIRKHPNFLGGIQCRIIFPQGTGISIINGRHAYCNEDTFEIAPLFDEQLTFINSWGDQVRGYVTEKEISEIVAFAETHTKEEYEEYLENYEFVN